MGPLDPAPPPGTAVRTVAGSPQNTPGKRRAGPLWPGLNSPSTVFFLKRDAMVRDRVWAARLGPVRSDPGWESTGGKGQALKGFGLAERRAREEGAVSRQDPRKAGTREAYRSGVAPGSGDRELRHFLEKSLLGGACALGVSACALRRLKLLPLPLPQLLPALPARRVAAWRVRQGLAVVAERGRRSAVSGSFSLWVRGVILTEMSLG